MIPIVFMCVFVIYIEFFPYCLFVSNSQVIGCEDRLRNDLYCFRWGVKLCWIQSILWNSCNKQWQSYRPVYSFSVATTQSPMSQSVQFQSDWKN